MALLVSVVSALCDVAWLSALRDNGCGLRQRLDRDDGLDIV